MLPPPTPNMTCLFPRTFPCLSAVAAAVVALVVAAFFIHECSKLVAMRRIHRIRSWDIVYTVTSIFTKIFVCTVAIALTVTCFLMQQLRLWQCLQCKQIVCKLHPAHECYLRQ